jgi:hypothetical protein
MKTVLIAVACAALALPGAALAQRGGGEGHSGGGHSGGEARGGGARGDGFHEGGGFRSGGDFHGGAGFRGSAGFRGGFASSGFRSRFAAGPIGRFGARDFDAWRDGFWWHGFRGSRLGWWWFTDGFWYWYDAPIYPYPEFVADYDLPGDSYGPGDPPGPVWYYCYNPAGYYPTVHACPSGWRVVPGQWPEARPASGQVPPPAATPRG